MFTCSFPHSFVYSLIFSLTHTLLFGFSGPQKQRDKQGQLWDLDKPWDTGQDSKTHTAVLFVHSVARGPVESLLVIPGCDALSKAQHRG